MKKGIIVFLFGITSLLGFAQFAPPVGQTGTTAIDKNSSVFIAWATGCTVTRGYQDISNISLGLTSAGDSSMALGKAGVNGTVSLGDGGYAIVTFDSLVKNRPGWDLAVFENSFNDTFLELAFVEVSSDGINYFRFPATSYTQDTIQVGTFGSVDATKINNLAGKYRASYGTPFDLEELISQPGLNIDSITHVKIIDAVGCIQTNYASYDQYGNKVNDPWKTAFASGGFDLDAVGVINDAATVINEEFLSVSELSVFPNPIKDNSTISYYLSIDANVRIDIVDVTGKAIVLQNGTQDMGWQMISLVDLNLNSGIYLLRLTTDKTIAVKKIIITNE